MESMATFKDRLKEVRESMGLNRRKFAKFVGFSNYSSIYCYEAGDIYPDIFNLRKICEKCNVSADWLLGLK